MSHIPDLRSNSSVFLIYSLAQACHWFFTVGSANICNLDACVSLTQSCLVQQTFQGIEQSTATLSKHSLCSSVLRSNMNQIGCCAERLCFLQITAWKLKELSTYFPYEEFHLLLQNCRLTFFHSSKDKTKRTSKCYLKSGLLALCSDGF